LEETLQEVMAENREKEKAVTIEKCNVSPDNKFCDSMVYPTLQKTMNYFIELLIKHSGNTTLLNFSRVAFISFFFAPLLLTHLSKK
jgi:hypothetical protein